jgi:hypothetical protein
MRQPRFLLGAALAALLAPTPSAAREESKIRLFMDSAPGSNAKGMLRSDLSPGAATLRIHASHLAPNVEHILYGDDVEVARFTTDAGGNAEIGIDLLDTGSGATPNFDPRGKLVRVNDGMSDVLTAWVYADPAMDPGKPRIKELTSLAHDPGNPQERLLRATADEGRVDARYDALPSGGARFWVQLRGVAPGDYDILVDGAMVASLTTNASGFGFLDLRVKPGGGNGMGQASMKPHHPRGPLTINPRDALIEVQQGGVTQFSGPMRAQIPGLGMCGASSMSVSLMLDPAQTMGSGSVSRSVETNCDTVLAVLVSGLTDGAYDLVVDATTKPGAIVVSGGVANVVYDETPDTAGEQMLDFLVQSGSSVAIKMGDTTFLTGMVP